MDKAEAEFGIPQPSQIPMGFPPYRRSHLRSRTYHTLVRILSHLSATQNLQIPDNGSGRMEQEKTHKEPERSEFVGSDFKDPKDPIPEKEIQEVREIIEGVGDKGREFIANKMVLNDIEHMMGIDEVENTSRQVEAMSMKASGFNMEQRLMDELELVVKGTEDLVCDNGSIPLEVGLAEKQNGSSEVDLMDYKVEHVEFLHSDVNKSGNTGKLRVQGELNKLASEGFHPSSMVNVSRSIEGQTSALAITTSSTEHEIQQKEMELVKSVCAEMNSSSTEESELKKEGQCGPKVAEAMHLSLDLDVNMCEDGGLLDSAILEDKHEIQNEEKSEKVICVNNALNSSNNPIEKEDIEEGEIFGDVGMDGNLFDMSSTDSLILQQKSIEEVQKPKNAVENIVFPCRMGNSEKEERHESSSFIVNALQDAHNSGQVEPRTSDKKGTAYGVEVAISGETIKVGEYGLVLKPGNSKDRQIGSKGVTDLPTNYAQNQVMCRGLLEVDATKDHGNSSGVKQKVDVSSKKKRGPGSEEKKAKKKQKVGVSSKKNCGPDSDWKKAKEKQKVDVRSNQKRGPCSETKKAKKKLRKRKKRAEMNRKLGVNRLRLPPPVEKPKAICHHYAKGRCHEGDKCHFSHDIEPETKSKPCVYFARHSCMKGDDCPFDHQLSKYSCINFKSRGCSRGDACMFSHQIQEPAIQDITMSSNVSKPELKSPLLQGNTDFSMPLNNRGCNPVRQNHFSNSMGIHSHTNAEHRVTNTVQKQPMPPPKGISFINISKSSLLSPSTPKQGTVTPNKESLVQIAPCADQNGSGTNQTLVEIPKKLPAVTPKGINFLSFGSGSVCSFKSSISSLLNKENAIKLPQLVNFGLPEQASSSLNKDDSCKVSDGTKQSVPQTHQFSYEILDKNQSVAEGVKLNFPGKSSIDDAATDLERSCYPHRDHGPSKSVQEEIKSHDNSPTSTVTSSMLLVSPFVSNQSSDRISSGFYKYASNSSQRALLSTLAFAEEHESDIKMKYPSGASPV